MKPKILIINICVCAIQVMSPWHLLLHQLLLQCQCGRTGQSPPLSCGCWSTQPSWRSRETQTMWVTWMDYKTGLAGPEPRGVKGVTGLERLFCNNGFLISFWKVLVESRDVLIFAPDPDQSFFLILSICQSNTIQYLFIFSFILQLHSIL